MKNKPIPLTKAAYKKQITQVMLKNGLSPEYYFNKVNLPEHDPENPESLLPLKPFWHLLNLVALDAGIPDFGSQIAQHTPWHEIESTRPIIASCKNLEDLLQTLCKLAPRQNNNMELILEYDQAGLWFSRPGPSFMHSDVQMELYRITAMIQMVQLTAGTSWLPEQIDLLMPANKIVRHSPLINKSHICFSQARSGFPIPRILLKLPVNLVINKTATQWEFTDINTDFVRVIQNLIGIFIHNKDCTIAEISNTTDIPVRTLQRRLKSHGTCFSDLLNQAKFKLAKDKLENSHSTITEISFQLGFSDPAHFTHAFQRWKDMSPSQYRQQFSKS